MPAYVSESSTLALFADDSKLYKDLLNSDDYETLQRDLDTLNHWYMDWNMEFSTSKCKVLNMYKKIVKSQWAYNLNFSILDLVTQTTDLGITITNNLFWSNHIDEITNKANKKLGLIRRKSRDNIDSQTRKTLYCSSRSLSIPMNYGHLMQ